MLGLIVTVELYSRHRDRAEGDLTFMRQRVVSREACAVVADACGLPQAMVAAAPARYLADAQDLADSQNAKAALAESVIGAGWLGPGPDATTAAVLGSFAAALTAAPERMRDAKTELQEEVARRGDSRVQYAITGEVGPPQARVFTARVTQDGRVLGEGSGRSKQTAERAAAQIALDGITGPGA